MFGAPAMAFCRSARMGLLLQMLARMGLLLGVPLLRLVLVMLLLVIQVRQLLSPRRQNCSQHHAASTASLCRWVHVQKRFFFCFFCPLFAFPR